MGRWMRNMRTTQELRQTLADDKEHLPVRRARLSLPTAWDDFWRYSQRTWKKHRKTQFKLMNLADANSKNQNPKDQT